MRLIACVNQANHGCIATGVLLHRHRVTSAQGRKPGDLTPLPESHRIIRPEDISAGLPIEARQEAERRILHHVRGRIEGPRQLGIGKERSRIVTGIHGLHADSIQGVQVALGERPYFKARGHGSSLTRPSGWQQDNPLPFSCEVSARPPLRHGAVSAGDVTRFSAGPKQRGTWWIISPDISDLYPWRLEEVSRPDR